VETVRKSSILDDFFDIDECAAELGVSAVSLARWRMQRHGPPVTHIGRNVYYRKSSVKAWVAAQEHPAQTLRTAIA
jgi:predicted DNA-binding transcriptional regulator AlpA